MRTFMEQAGGLGYRWTLLACMLLSASCDSGGETASRRDVVGEEVVWPAAEYVGSYLCRDCHAQAYAAWEGSQHQRAMARATADTALGDFDGSTFTYGNVVTTFETADDGQLWVTTDDSRGEPATFHVTHTFGVEPLQQYLLDVGGGRLQALSIAWETGRDSRAADGGRWFHLYPDETVRAGDVLHWTARSQNWNGMCADCHSTNVVNGFDAANDRFATTVSEISVGCEACHGPASNHLAWVGEGGAPAANPGYGAQLAEQGVQIDACARCHSRRSKIAEGFAAGGRFLDHYMPALLVPPLYHGDGQILDEVYVYGSFLQSRMYQRGVVCSDCHEPHSGTLRASGNAVCTQCHSPAGRADFPTLPRKRYDDSAHHLHPVGSPGAACVACHMPERTYMVIDDRRDHSFRIPRPDLSQSVGVPNACDGCHDQGAGWASQVIIEHFGPERPPHFGATLAAAFSGRVDDEQPLAELARDPEQPAIVRASILAQLGGFSRGYSLDAVRAGLRADDPLVNIGALRSINRLDPQTRWRYVSPLLAHETRAVRTEAALAALPMLQVNLNAADRARLDAALAEYLDGQQLNADRPEAHTNVAIAELARGDPLAAEASLKKALALEPRWIPALVNLADLYRVRGREAEAGELLARAASMPLTSGDAVYAHALWLTRAGNPAEALPEFRRAAALAPDVLQFSYAYALALNGAGQADEAIATLEATRERFGDQRDLLTALATIHRDRGNVAEARRYAQRLVELFPMDAGLQRLLAELGGAP